jgi:hypothetical protein
MQQENRNAYITPSGHVKAGRTTIPSITLMQLFHMIFLCDTQTALLDTRHIHQSHLFGAKYMTSDRNREFPRLHFQARSWYDSKICILILDSLDSLDSPRRMSILAVVITLMEVQSRT